jgi:hypothetical protein
MRRLTVSRTIDAPAEAAWNLLTRVDDWPSWGTSIRSATLDDGAERVGPGATGTLTTVFGVRLPFTVTGYAEGTQWRWKVAGVPATGHGVRASTDGRCEVWFDVPILAGAYTAVCRVALGNIARILEQGR